MATNLKALPADPLDKGDTDEANQQGTETSKPKKRTRRTRKQIDADDEAISLGFKNDADRKAKEKPLTKPKDVETEILTDKTEKDKTSEDPEPTVVRTGIFIGTRWNLGGSAYLVDAIHDDGRLTFKPCLPSK